MPQLAEKDLTHDDKDALAIMGFKVGETIEITPHPLNDSHDPSAPQCQSTEATISEVPGLGLYAYAKCRICSYVDRVEL